MRYTKIPWCDETWNPVVGCRPMGPGCERCYAANMAARFSAGHYRGLAQMEGPRGQWTGRVKFFRKNLLEPWRRLKGRKIFVCSMGDLFHDKVSPDWIDQVFAIMAGARRHTFMVLTKRPLNMACYLNGMSRPRLVWLALERLLASAPKLARRAINLDRFVNELRWPLQNVWCGTSAENQQMYDRRVAALAEAKAAVRFVSLEPLLGPVDLKLEFQPKPIDWVIAGAESGTNGRPMDENWVRSLRNQAAKAGAAFFYKQRRKDYLSMEETPELDGRRWTEFPK